MYDTQKTKPIQGQKMNIIENKEGIYTHLSVPFHQTVRKTLVELLRGGIKPKIVDKVAYLQK